MKYLDLMLIIKSNKIFPRQIYCYSKFLRRRTFFLSSLIQLLNNEKIDVYLPLHSSEIRVISKYEDYIKSLSNTKFIVSEFRSFMFLDNKKNLYISLADLGIRVPKIFDENTPPLSNEFPIFLNLKLAVVVREQ